MIDTSSASRGNTLTPMVERDTKDGGIIDISQALKDALNDTSKTIDRLEAKLHHVMLTPIKPENPGKDVPNIFSPFQEEMDKIKRTAIALNIRLMNITDSLTL